MKMPPYPGPRQVARSQGLSRYHGKVCPKHPENGGERRVRNRNCIKCEREHLRVSNMSLAQAQHRSDLAVARRRARFTTDIDYKIKCTSQSRIWGALHGIREKSDRTLKLLGCSTQDFKVHMKTQFKPGMTWENHGVVWEIDHIRPLDAYDLTDPVQQREAFNYLNCQPLFIRENRAKGSKRHLIYALIAAFSINN